MDWFWLEIWFGSIRARIIRIENLISDSFRLLPRIMHNRIMSDRFFSAFHQTRYKTFFGLVRDDSHWFGMNSYPINSPGYSYFLPMLSLIFLCIHQLKFIQASSVMKLAWHGIIVVLLRKTVFKKTYFSPLYDKNPIWSILHSVNIYFYHFLIVPKLKWFLYQN